MNKDELIKLLQDEKVAKTILNLVKKINIKKMRSKKNAAKEAAEKRKLDKDAEKKSSLSGGIIQKLRSRVARAAAKEEEKQLIKKEIVGEYIDEDVIDDEFLEFEALSENFSEEEILNETLEEVPKSLNLAGKLEKLRNHVLNRKKSETPKKEKNEKKKTQKPAPKQESDYRMILKRVCPVCERETRVIKYKSRLPVERFDVDLCVRYKGINPYLYTVMACEHCGFAAEERKFTSPLPKRHKEALMEFLANEDMVVPFNEKRSVEEAIQLTEIAVLFCDLTDASPSRKAHLYLKIAWIYRYANNKEQEKVYLQKAAEMYDESLATERVFAGNISDNTVVYILSAIYYLMENYSKATSYLSRIIGDQNIKAQEPRIYDRARDLWQDIRLLKKSGELKNV